MAIRTRFGVTIRAGRRADMKQSSLPASMNAAIAALPARVRATLAQPIPHIAVRRALERCGTHDDLRGELLKLLPVLYRSRFKWWTHALRHLYMAGYAAARRREGAGIRYVIPLSWGKAPAKLLGVTRRATRRLSTTAYAADQIVRLQQLQAVVDDWESRWPERRDPIEDDEKRALFEGWKRERLASGRWGRLPVEEWNLFVTPLLELAYMQGHYRAMRKQARRLPRWRFERGATCRRHDALDGLVARYNDPVWKTSLPPLAYGCDCTVRAISGYTGTGEHVQLPADAPPRCRLFGNDKRGSPNFFVVAYIALMREECLPDCPPAVSANSENHAGPADAASVTRESRVLPVDPR